MWRAVTEFLLKAHASGLSHEAVIEIMVALLGVMVAVLAILSVMVSLVFGALGIFGFQLIRVEAKKAAKLTAEKIAKEITNQTIALQLSKEQAIDLSASQPPTKRTKAATKPPSSSVRKTTDSGLSRARKEK